MTVVVSVVSVVSVSGECQWSVPLPVHKEWTGNCGLAPNRPAEYPGHAVSATVVRDRGAARCRGAAVPRRDRRRAGNLALAGTRDREPRTVNLMTSRLVERNGPGPSH